MTPGGGSSRTLMRERQRRWYTGTGGTREIDNKTRRTSQGNGAVRLQSRGFLYGRCCRRRQWIALCLLLSYAIRSSREFLCKIFIEFIYFLRQFHNRLSVFMRVNCNRHRLNICEKDETRRALIRIFSLLSSARFSARLCDCRNDNNREKKNMYQSDCS